MKMSNSEISHRTHKPWDLLIISDLRPYFDALTHSQGLDRVGHFTMLSNRVFKNFLLSFCFILKEHMRDMINCMLTPTCPILLVLFCSAINVRLKSVSTLNYTGPHRGEKLICNVGNNVICNSFYLVTIFTVFGEFYCIWNGTMEAQQPKSPKVVEKPQYNCSGFWVLYSFHVQTHTLMHRLKRGHIP